MGFQLPYQDSNPSWAADWRRFSQLNNQGILGQELDTTRRDATRAGIGGSPGFLQSLQNPSWKNYATNTAKSEADIGRSMQEWQQLMNQLAQNQNQFNQSMSWDKLKTFMGFFKPNVSMPIPM